MIAVLIWSAINKTRGTAFGYRSRPNADNIGRMLRRNSAALIALILTLILLPTSCALVRQTLETGGEKQLKPVPPPPPPAATHVLIFALDGAVPGQLMEAVHSGHAPYI